ncbi:MAG: DUF4381 family protein [Pseudomonadota bacterium]
MQAPAPPIRDIHAAPAPPFWPPAWGWWVVAGLVVVGLCWGVWALWRRWRWQKRFQALGQELDEMQERWRDDGDVGRAASRASLYLRRLVLHEARDSRAAALTGDSWVEFLTAPENLDPHLKVAAAELAKAPYQAMPDINVESVFQLCHFWLRRVVHV